MLLRGREHDPLRRFGFDAPQLDEIARSDARVGALKSVDAQDLEALVLGIGKDCAGWGRALPDDLDHVAFLDSQPGHHVARNARQAPAAVLGTRVRDLNTLHFVFAVGHLSPRS